MSLAIGCHLGLLMLMLRPATHRYDAVSVGKNDMQSLELRFIPVRTQRPVASPPVVQRQMPVKHSKPPVVHAVVPTASTAPVSPPVPADARLPSASAPTSFADGGFQQQLRNAQQSHAAPGIPGSDMRRAPGLQLTDPMHQGIGSVLRSAQRLFGVTNSHCVDVDVLSSLSPEALAERHLSPRDVARMNEKYDCNRPLGLSF